MNKTWLKTPSAVLGALLLALFALAGCNRNQTGMDNEKSAQQPGGVATPNRGTMSTPGMGGSNGGSSDNSSGSSS